MRHLTVFTKNQILPTAPEVAHIHDRMLVILNPADLAAWLTGSEDDVRRSLDHALMTGFATEPVSRLVSSHKHDSPDLLNPIALPPKPSPLCWRSTASPAT